MLRSKFTAAIGGAFVLAMTTVQPAAAQTNPDYTTDSAAKPEATQEESPNRRLGRHERPRRQPRPTAPVAPTPEELVASAQLIATAAAINCQVTEAVELGLTTEQEAVYEAACATGPGYILISSTPPQGVDCVLLAGQGQIARAADPAADVGQQCTLPANQNVIAVVQAYANEAGVDCTVDRGSAIGKTSEEHLMYEVGCANQGGYWLEQTPAGWKTTACWELVGRQYTCRYTTEQQANSAWKSVLAGTDAAACDVTHSRRVGTDAAQLAIYEVKCAVGDGFFVRVGDDRHAQRVHPCAEATHIGGGCTIGVPAAVTPAE
ncbi:hypothetical protein [uncultured Brevundimonas sp.]|uniref:hypothetical protein n=1 Tax=uncultured Brevundimonas sp. TaxID=213418 RepID=UPI0030EEBA85